MLRLVCLLLPNCFFVKCITYDCLIFYTVTLSATCMFDIREWTLFFCIQNRMNYIFLGSEFLGILENVSSNQNKQHCSKTQLVVKLNGMAKQAVKKPFNISLSHPHWLLTLVLPVFLDLEWVKIIIIVICKLKEGLICLLMSRDTSKSEIMYLILDTIICNLLVTDFMFGKIGQRKTFHETN